VDGDEIISKLAGINYQYDTDKNQFI